MSDRPTPLSRDAFRWFTGLDTRFGDNDVFGHVNNVIYYSYFDTAVNRHLIEAGLLDLETSPAVGLVAETSCAYFASVAYPEPLEVGLAVARLGETSVTYRLGLFRERAEMCVALCRYTHVYVLRRLGGRPTAIPPAHRKVFENLQA